MKHKVQFITLEDKDKDLIVSFAIGSGGRDIRSLTLLRTPVYEALLPEVDRGVRVSFVEDELVGDESENDDGNFLVSIEIGESDVVIESTIKEYKLISRESISQLSRT